MKLLKENQELFYFLTESLKLSFKNGVKMFKVINSDHKHPDMAAELPACTWAAPSSWSNRSHSQLIGSDVMT